MHSFTHAVHEEARGTGVRVMLVCPGYTHTEFHDRAGLGDTDLPEFVWQSADAVVDAALSRPRPRAIGVDPGRAQPDRRRLLQRLAGRITRRVAGVVVKRSG